MRAHIVDADGYILNTVMVDHLAPGMRDASIGGGAGDRIINGVVTPKALPVPSMAEHNAPILAALEALDAKSIRPLREGDAVRVAALEQQAAALRLTLRKD